MPAELDGDPLDSRLLGEHDDDTSDELPIFRLCHMGRIEGIREK
jgi:hypothetical protein